MCFGDVFNEKERKHNFNKRTATSSNSLYDNKNIIIDNPSQLFA